MIARAALDPGLASDSRILCHAGPRFLFFPWGLGGWSFWVSADRPMAKYPVLLSTMNILVTIYLGTDYTMILLITWDRNFRIPKPWDQANGFHRSFYSLLSTLHRPELPPDHLAFYTNLKKLPLPQINKVNYFSIITITKK